MICSKCKEHIEVSPFEHVAYCPKCGNKVDYNYCSEGCKDIFFNENPKILDDNDWYCKHCGAKSTYHVQGILEED